jgi:hypothetical protein
MGATNHVSGEEYLGAVVLRQTAAIRRSKNTTGGATSCQARRPIRDISPTILPLLGVSSHSLHHESNKTIAQRKAWPSWGHLPLTSIPSTTATSTPTRSCVTRAGRLPIADSIAKYTTVNLKYIGLQIGSYCFLVAVYFVISARPPVHR